MVIRSFHVPQGMAEVDPPTQSVLIEILIIRNIIIGGVCRIGLGVSLEDGVVVRFYGVP